MVLRPSVESDILNFWLSVLLYTTRAGDRPESDPGEGRGGGYVDCIKIVKIVLTVPPFNIKIVN